MIKRNQYLNEYYLIISINNTLFSYSIFIVFISLSVISSIHMFLPYNLYHLYCLKIDLKNYNDALMIHIMMKDKY